MYLIRPVLEDSYTGAIARVHMDNQVSEEIPILRGVRQGDPISPKLFTATRNKYRWRKTVGPKSF